MKQPSYFLIANYTIRPRNPGLTFQKGYMKQDENIQYSESVSIARKLRDSDLTQAQVIIDITAERVIKCSYQGQERNYENLLDYYVRHYPSYLNPVLEQLGRITEPSPAAAVQSEGVPSP